MRFSLRPLVYCSVLFVVLVAATACSSLQHVSSPSVPSGQTNAGASHHPLDVAAFPSEILAWAADITAFPNQIDAFGSEIGADPVTTSAAPICPPNSNGNARCFSQYRTDIPRNPNAALPPTQVAGYQPSQLQDAYGLGTASATNGAGQTIAIIIAYDAPSLAADLTAYRTEFGLPPCATATGCLQFVYAAGSQPSSDPGWSAEATLDAEMVSAICPLCKIMVVESPDANIKNLANAVSVAVANGATEVSNSYSVPEQNGMQPYAKYYSYPGVPITAAAGDQGYGVGFPANYATVTAVGGTSIVKTPNGWASAVWSGTGSGCSLFVNKPLFQTDLGCTNRTDNDLAVVADPATGVAAYVSGVGGWGVFGGTSVGAPIVAALYALAGNGATINDPSHLYANPQWFAPVTARANGTCSPSYLCHGGPAYNGPSGLGSPVGLAAF